MVDKKWVIKDSEIETFQLDDLKFVFQQVEKRLQDTLDTNNLITNRINLLLTLLMGLIITLAGYGFKKIIEEPENIGVLTYMCFVSASYYLIIVYLLYRDLFPHKYAVPGEIATKLIDQYFLEKNESIRIKYLYGLQIDTYQFRIDNNKAINESKWKRYESSLLLIFISPILLGVVCILLTI